ncbi:MAG: hypothetical protein ACE5KF_08690, partial [Kiloniellaceae bacterium]
MSALIRLLFAVALLIGAPAEAGEPVAVRVGEHPGFSRLVFDWGKPVGTRLDQEPGRATLRFDRPAELDLSRYRADPPPEILRIEVVPDGQGLTVRLSIPKEAKLRLFQDRGKVVLDVLKPGTRADAPAAEPGDWRRRQAAKQRPPKVLRSKPEPAAAAPVPVPRPARKADRPDAVAAAPVPHPDGPAPGKAPIPLLAPSLTGSSAPEAQGAGAKESGAKGQAPAARGAAKVVTKARAEATAPPIPRPKPEVAPTVRTPAGGRASGGEPVAGRPAGQAPAGRATGAAPAGGAPASLAAAEADQTAVTDKTPVSADPAPVVIETTPAPARSAELYAPVMLRFAWDGAVAAAAYRRGGYLWLVFDRPPPGDLSRRIAKVAPQLAPVAQYALSGATVIRLTAPPAWGARLTREDSAWIVDLWSQAALADNAIVVEVDARGGPAQVLFHVTGAGRPLWFTDPVLGDRIAVVPVSVSGQGLSARREFLQFRALATSQGVVLQPLSESIEIAVTAKGVRVRDSEGLIVSYGSTLALLASNVRTPPKGPRLFDLEAWRRGGKASFTSNKQALQKAVPQAPDRKINAARLELARFYFAHGLAAEALGVLGLRETEDPRLATDPETRLMKGASEFLIEDYEAAADTLFDPALAGEWEAALWRAAMAAVSLDWSAAATGFAGTEALIADYPHQVRSRLRLLAAEAYLGIADTEGADRYLAQVRRDEPSHAEVAQIAFLVARRLQLEGDVAGAEELWRKVAESNHLPSRTRARLALVDLGLENGSITLEQGIEELERLRFAWRGDRFEFALLQRLGDIYIARHDYRRGLRALRQAASHFPKSERSHAVAQRMREVFADLYLGDAGTGLPPLRALALYEEFKELTPVGARGDEVITRLADRLVEVDLLDRAAVLLDSQVRYRLAGVPKARVGTRLALIRLLDREPAKAIAGLDLSEIPNLPEDLARRRRYLKVRALSALGRRDEALALLGADDSADGLRLRADILWAQRNWTATALVLARLAPARPPADRPITEAESQTLVSLAVALTLAGERDKLIELGKRFKAAMAAGSQRDTFALLVGDLEPGKVKSIAERLAQVDQVRAFMASYRERLQQAGPGQRNRPAVRATRTDPRGPPRRA